MNYLPLGETCLLVVFVYCTVLQRLYLVQTTRRDNSLSALLFLTPLWQLQLTKHTVYSSATVTSLMREDSIRKLDMDGCCLVSESPDKPNIIYEVVRKNTIEEDFSSVVRDLAERNIKARRVVVYCQSLDMCASLYAHFLHYLQDASYYPPGVEQVSDNRLFAMFHSCTDEHNKRVVMSSLSQADGVVRVVFATTALGMGVDFKSLDYMIHYGAPRSLHYYMQESGRAGRDHQQSVSRIYWKPVEAPRYADQTVHRNVQLKGVRDYLVNTELILLRYFDPVVAMSLGPRDKELCCVNCQSHSQCEDAAPI
eukprot:Em0021g1002a